MLQRLKSQSNLIAVLISAVLFLIAWQALIVIGDYQPFILPGPIDVWEQTVRLTAEGSLPKHTWHTVSEVVPGLLIGALIALPLGYLLAKSPWAEKLLSPYIVASRAVPIIAIAPLLTIWIRSTYWSRVIVAVIVVFFPILVNFVTGIRTVPPELHDLMTSLRASRWQIFTKLELPASLPLLLAGLKVGATLSVIGALVGEFVQPRSQGLGYLLLTSRYQFRTDSVFAVLFALAVITLALYGVVVLLERWLLRWQLK